MIRTLLSSLLVTSVACAMAQPYAIGNTARNWYDAVRMRDVPAELHYPALADGDDQPAAAGAFPCWCWGMAS
ncbi:MAG: hypothetical protein IPG74_15440 [Flavobacteriales bacterium]|nr:hypothetical protein [Flavobacteriales bacterium]